MHQLFIIGIDKKQNYSGAERKSEIVILVDAEKNKLCGTAEKEIFRIIDVESSQRR